MERLVTRDGTGTDCHMWRSLHYSVGTTGPSLVTDLLVTCDRTVTVGLIRMMAHCGNCCQLLAVVFMSVPWWQNVVTGYASRPPRVTVSISQDGEVQRRVIGWPLRVGGRLADSVMCEHEHRTVSTEKKNKLVLLNTQPSSTTSFHFSKVCPRFVPLTITFRIWKENES